MNVATASNQMNISSTHSNMPTPSPNQQTLAGSPAPNQNVPNSVVCVYLSCTRSIGTPFLQEDLGRPDY